MAEASKGSVQKVRSVSERILKGSQEEKMAAVDEIILSSELFSIPKVERLGIFAALEVIAKTVQNPGERNRAVQAFARFAEDPDFRVRRTVAKFFADLEFIPLWSDYTKRRIESALVRLKSDSDRETRQYAAEAHSLIFGK